jgi:transcription termination factor Rho
MDMILKWFVIVFLWAFNASFFLLKNLNYDKQKSTISTRIIDLFSYWKGQRGMIVAQPKKQVKRCYWKEIANALGKRIIQRFT